MSPHKLPRRKFLLVSGATLAAAQLTAALRASATTADWSAQWIWYPGQLAAYRHSRRVRLAVTRCAYVGYPANFRQPVTETWFRKFGVADRDIPLRWTGPVARIRTTIGGRGGDITNRRGVLRAGQSNLEVQLDFAQSLPCLLLEGAEFSTGPSWEASLDGEHWVPAETSTGGDPSLLPDAEREISVALPVARIIQPEGPPRDSYALSSGGDLLLDFSETELGSLRFSAHGRGQLSIQVGESIPEVRDPDPAAMEQFPLPPINLTAEPAEITLPQRALRYVRLTATGDAQLANVRFDARLWPARELGHFESSDADLNAIWATAVSTLRSNMHDFYLDGIRRDALLWHDGPLTLDAYERVFFDADLSRQTLIAETLPEHPSLRDVGILDSPMYDVLGFHRELLVRGDPSFSRMFRGRIEDILHFLASLQDSRGFISAASVQPYGFFPDWSVGSQPGPDVHGAPAYAQMLLAATFSAAARLAQAWGNAAASEEYRASAERVQRSIRESFWNSQEGLYANGFDTAGKLDARVSSFAQAFAIAYGVALPGEYPQLFAFLNDPARRSQHFSLSQMVELTAYAKAGRAEQAVQRLKSAWLPMLRAGYRRFFEDIDATKPPSEQLAMYGRKYAASLCHAWAGAAPVMALSRGVLGVEPLEPGYALCSIAPQRCGLTWLHGAVPTPHGPIQIEWNSSSARIVLPANVAARFSDNRELRGPGSFPIPVLP
jgi:alpha-L-rhamnosidase